MSIFSPLSPIQELRLREFLSSTHVSDGCLDYVALHGFLTGIATGPESLIETDWLKFIFDTNPNYHSKSQQLEIEELINQLSMFLRRSLYLGEDILLPCALSPSIPGESNELTDWCFGFIESIAVDEDTWFSNSDITESISELILPVGVLSGQFIDPEISHLTDDPNTRNKMAEDLVENIQNLYLLFRE